MKTDLGLADAESLGADTLGRVRSPHRGGRRLARLVPGPRSGGSAAAPHRPAAAGHRRRRERGDPDETGTEAQLFDLVSRAGGRLRASLGAGELSAADAGTLKASLPPTRGRAALCRGPRAFAALRRPGRPQPSGGGRQGGPRLRARAGRAGRGLDRPRLRREGAEAARRAYEGPARSRARSGLAIEARFRQAAREWPKAVELYRSLWTFFPDDLDHGLRLANAQISAARGRTRAHARRPPEAAGACLGRSTDRADGGAGLGGAGRLQGRARAGVAGRGQGAGARGVAPGGARATGRGVGAAAAGPAPRGDGRGAIRPHAVRGGG
jgi:hypothetical protein